MPVYIVIDQQLMAQLSPVLPNEIKPNVMAPCPWQLGSDKRHYIRKEDRAKAADHISQARFVAEQPLHTINNLLNQGKVGTKMTIFQPLSLCTQGQIWSLRWREYGTIFAPRETI